MPNACAMEYTAKNKRKQTQNKHTHTHTHQEVVSKGAKSQDAKLEQHTKTGQARSGGCQPSSSREIILRVHMNFVLCKLGVRHLTQLGHTCLHAISIHGTLYPSWLALTRCGTDIHHHQESWTIPYLLGVEPQTISGEMGRCNHQCPGPQVGLHPA